MWKMARNINRTDLILDNSDNDFFFFHVEMEKKRNKISFQRLNGCLAGKLIRQSL